ncbi:uncharacterized protein [Periplaneta americana]|uniref:uncharacterized protein isoform X2 n=1 Tax=Periplaneta americana TaxID=6978 RepID=UPI0037E76DF5
MQALTGGLLRAAGLVLMVLATGAVTAAAVVSTDVDEGDLFLPDDGDLVLYTRERRVPGQPVAVAASSGDAPAPGDVKWTLGLGKRESRFTPYISVGVLSNMQQFFDSLRTNLESLEQLPHDEREALLGQQVSNAAEQGPAFRPKATAAYLHALRNHRPSHKIRNFVSESEPATLRGSNHYDPNWLWTGLGRKR